MNDFLKKLNVLVKATVNDAVSGDRTSRPPRADKRLDDDIQGLRQRVNEAVEYEDEMQARVRQFEDEAARWDQQADEAVAQGNDTNARYAIEQMKRAEQRAALAQSDLQEHQRVTQELIQRVNMLESAVADKRAADAQTQPPPDAQTESAETEQTDAQASNIRLPDLSNILRDARDKITSLSEVAAQRDTLSTDDEAQAQQAEAETSAEVDDDLARRRDRLSKR